MFSMLEEKYKKKFRRIYFKDNKKSVKPIMRLRCALSIKIFLWKRSKGSANRLVRAKTDLIKNTKAKSVSNFSRRKFSSWNSSFSIHQQFSSLPKSSQDMNEQKVLPLYYLLSYHLGLAANPLPSKNSFVYPLALYLFVVSACLANSFLIFLAGIVCDHICSQ